MKSFAAFLVRNRIPVLAGIAIVTVFFLFQASKISLKTDFNDILPRKHSFIKVHNNIRDIFGEKCLTQLLLM